MYIVSMHQLQDTVGVRGRPSAVGSLFLLGTELKSLHLATSAAY